MLSNFTEEEGTNYCKTLLALRFDSTVSFIEAVSLLLVTTLAKNGWMRIVDNGTVKIVVILVFSLLGFLPTNNL